MYIVGGFQGKIYVSILLVISFPVLVRNLSAKHKWQDALSEGVNGLGCCGGRGVPWGDAGAEDRAQVRLHPGAGDKGEGEGREGERESRG